MKAKSVYLIPARRNTELTYDLELVQIVASHEVSVGSVVRITIRYSKA